MACERSERSTDPGSRSGEEPESSISDAVCAIIYAAPRTELKELQILREMLMHKVSSRFYPIQGARMDGLELIRPVWAQLFPLPGSLRPTAPSCPSSSHLQTCSLYSRARVGRRVLVGDCERLWGGLDTRWTGQRGSGEAFKWG